MHQAYSEPYPPCNVFWCCAIMLLYSSFNNDNSDWRMRDELNGFNDMLCPQLCSLQDGVLLGLSLACDTHETSVFPQKTDWFVEKWCRYLITGRWSIHRSRLLKTPARGIQGENVSKRARRNRVGWGWQAFQLNSELFSPPYPEY